MNRLSAYLPLLLVVACSEGDVALEPNPLVPTVEIIATGANIAGANGIAFGPDGLLYAASVVGSDISVLDPNSGERVRHYTARDGVIGPDDIAFAPDGAFYWTSILTGEVAGFNTAGEKVIAAQLPPGPNPITFSPDGRLFVAQCFLGTNLYELDPTGEAAPRIISDTLGPGCGLNGMDWGPDNRLYGPRWFTGEIVSFDVDDNSMRVEAAGFETPAAVKFNSKGELHVLDTARGEISSVADGVSTVAAKLSPGLDNFAFDDQDQLFVSSFADGFISAVNKDGSTRFLQPGGMAHAGGITIKDGKAIVADLHAIRSYNITTGEAVLTQRNIVGVGEMGGALNIAADGDNLILTSWFDGDVRIWDPVGKKRMAQYPDLQGPVSAVRYNGDITVAEHGKHRVVAFSDGHEIELATDLPAPTGLLIEQRNLYVSDRILGQILMIASAGKKLNKPVIVADNLTTPEGFVMTNRGFVVVEADLGFITEVNSAGDRRILAEIPPGTQAGSPAFPPSQVFNGIALVREGLLIVTGETNRSLYRISF